MDELKKRYEINNSELASILETEEVKKFLKLLKEKEILEKEIIKVKIDNMKKCNHDIVVAVNELTGNSKSKKSWSNVCLCCGLSDRYIQNEEEDLTEDELKINMILNDDNHFRKLKESGINNEVYDYERIVKLYNEALGKLENPTREEIITYLEENYKVLKK